MLFNSINFLIFFPIVVLIYFVFPCKWRHIWLLLTSYYFYMCWNPEYVVLLIISTIITYMCGYLLERMSQNINIGLERRKRLMKLILASSFIINIGTLIYFKYTGFFIDTLNTLLNKIHFSKIPSFDILLPVGISFYIFQALGYTMDVYRGKVKSEKNVLKYALFVSFFPQLVAGPIERTGNLLNQIREEAGHKLWDYRRITSGLTIMLWGFFVKVVIADRAAVLVDNVFTNYEQYQMAGLSMGAVAFAVQIYCDFAGYSMIAIGAAKVLGFKLMENFNTPYFARSVVEFWRRWHISLSTWFRDYLYIPLGGSRCSKWKHYRNIIITFGVSGLWHGADWSYVVWGLLHGLYQIAEKEIAPLVNKINVICKTKTTSFGYKLFKVFITFSLVDIAWIFFRADSVHQAFHYIERMFRYRDWWSFFDQSLYKMGLGVQQIHILLMGSVILFLVDLVRYKKGEDISVFLDRQWIVFRWGVLISLFFICIIFGYYGHGFDSAQFIYFQF